MAVLRWLLEDLERRCYRRPILWQTRSRGWSLRETLLGVPQVAMEQPPMPSRGDRIVTVRGQRWRMRFVPNLGDKAGECDYGSRILRIAQGQPEAEELDTVVHEILHAAYPDIEEDAIGETGEAIAKALWRLGWRKHPRFDAKMRSG